jgi:hypothetical protein
VEVADPSGAELVAKVLDNQDGTYSVSYQAVDAGVHVVDVVLRHRSMPVYYEHIKDRY